jgi:hypothetical protein
MSIRFETIIFNVFTMSLVNEVFFFSYYIYDSDIKYSCYCNSDLSSTESRVTNYLGLRKNRKLMEAVKAMIDMIAKNTI